MPTDTFVQVSPNSTGAKIRNVSLTVLQADGTLATVLVQATSVVDADTGRALDVEGQEWRDEVEVLLRSIRRGIEIMCDEEIREEALEPE